MTFTLHDKSFFEQPLVKLFSAYIQDSNPERRITDLYLSPELIETDKNFQFSAQGSAYQINCENLKNEDIVDGLCIMFGFGLICPNYDFKVYHALSMDVLYVAKNLAVEIWDRRIHLDFMLNYRGHDGHNESKDLEFCKLLAAGKTDEAKEKHAKDCLEGRDTPHYFKLRDFVNYLKRQKSVLKEIFDDQASISGRHFKKKDRLTQAHCNYQGEILGKGIQIEEHGETLHWNRSCFTDFLIDNIQNKYWKEWKESNIAFCKYWTSKFGPLNQKYIPPNI